MKLPSPLFILIGNYPPDRQESMIRFTNLLADGLRSRGMTVEIVAPQPLLLGKNSHPGKDAGKWLGYADKWIFFPWRLRQLVRRRRREFGNDVRYHICDHSNAPYLAHLPRNRTVLTCHDVLAIRGALGYPEAYCAASRTGLLLQRWILRHLGQAQQIACVSGQTLRHLCELTGHSRPQPGWRVVHNALNAEFSRLEPPRAARILEATGVAPPFLLHVGSNLPRKNRRLLLALCRQGSQSWQGNICFAGDPMDSMLAGEARALGILARIQCLPRPDHRTLCALYNLAHAFVFPSFSEGFGWPLIEAQACGTPVITSNLEPLLEIAGGGALHADPHDPKSFAAALESLKNPATRQSLTEKGLRNIARFALAPMIDKYLELHQLNRPAEVCPQTETCCSNSSLSSCPGN